MNALAYFMLAGLAALFICLRIKNERQKRQRYKTRLDMDVEVQFQESVDPHDHMRRGSIMLTLHRCDDDVKGIVIKKVSFSDDVFYVPGFDTLYFKKNNDKSQLLSTSFRIRRHNLRRFEGKQLYVTISGWISETDGKQKLFKARIPYRVQHEEIFNPLTF